MKFVCMYDKRDNAQNVDRFEKNRLCFMPENFSKELISLMRLCTLV